MTKIVYMVKVNSYNTRMVQGSGEVEVIVTRREKGLKIGKRAR